MKNEKIKKTTLTAVFLSIGLVLPFLTAQVPEIGERLLPLHIPVFLCSMICGPQYGVICGVCLPFLRALIFGMPELYPSAVSMGFELPAYALVCGLIYLKFKKKNLFAIYTSLVTAMLAGRLVYAVVQSFILGLGEDGLTLSVFIAKAFTKPLPGIVLQLILIPTIVMTLNALNKKEKTKKT
ncbi:MAG: ECF transporter S component [Clostridia bacterium]|nr:ECF transporter S component [Clostridia bacterium]